jgi:uncharacterized protein YwqG
MRRYISPALALSLTESRTTRSVFGGAPLVPKDFEWPTYTPPPRKYPPAVLKNLGIPQPPDPVPRALDFLLQLDLAGLPSLDEPNQLPTEGLLTFFYDCENQPWGYDPAHQDSFRVVLLSGDDLVTRLPPNPPLEARGLVLSPGETLPHIGSRTYDQLTAETDLPDSYFEFVSEFERGFYPGNGGTHRLFGHSSNVQGDMQLEAQLVSHGLYCGDSSGYSDPRRESLEAGASDWILLLQLDSDDGAQVMWGDMGMLYFWIRRQDLATRRFDRAWFTLQCG